MTWPLPECGGASRPRSTIWDMKLTKLQVHEEFYG